MHPSQSQQIREQLIKQIDSTFPADKKEVAIQEINKMDDSRLEEFLIKNNLIKAQETLQNQQTQPKCIFCAILSGQIPSFKLDENKKAVAILEINPISKGHAMAIPKEHVTTSGKLPSQTFTLAKKLSKKIKSKLKPKEVKIISSNLMGHEFLNILPIYGEETLDSERIPAKPEELEKLKKLLETKPRKKAARKLTKKNTPKEERFKLPKRVP